MFFKINPILIILFLTLFQLIGLNLFAQNKALSPRTASYDIAVTLDVENKRLQAKEIVYFKNPSKDTIRELQFHLYYNAFKNSQSTFFKKSNRSS